MRRPRTCGATELRAGLRSPRAPVDSSVVGGSIPARSCFPRAGASLVADEFGSIREMIRLRAGVGFLPGFLAEPTSAIAVVGVLPDVVQRGGTLHAPPLQHEVPLHRAHPCSGLPRRVFSRR
jgi:DNA-binding transcriptional LysR family regulator